ncbi:NEL-type E3 ubiquitin ligase domain-containing protein [Pseudomonas sp. Z18(2022)]|uniref:NEL-type E3 ubiquitin ligase domain-containing protein n=1 Tax=Pseudomonas sp. Z18(2022) TaxID=2983410 RepID=UPI002E8171B1|nr:NEL-type E3 ubiquitin ligase domain-containing protein [Pseudomonas sp. Z18(2022)]
MATTLEGDSVKYGNQSASRAETLRVSRDDLVNGLLPRRIVEFLDERELEDLIEIYPPKDPQARIDALRDQLENHAKGAKARLMRSIYETQRPKVDSPVALIQRDFSSLPGLMAQELLADVPPKQLQKMVDSRRIPLELAENARMMQRRFRLALAYEGLYLEAMAGPDTEALMLNTLPALPGWSDNLRLEIREAGVEGVLRASLGPKNATDRKILVRVGDGRYQAFDGRGQQLHGINGLYGTLQHALPDAHRNRIGLPHVGQGEELQALPALTANFDHVTYVGLYDVDVTDADIVPFLANFRGLRRLNVEACELTQLPAAIEQMPHLRRLSLGGNHIVLTSEDVLRLKGCVQLRELALSINPLGLSPDVSRMPLLRRLLLNDTGLQEWPTGVFRVPRPADFILDMQSNPLSRVPEFAPGSDKALIVARTFLSRDGLEPDELARFKSYIEAAGRDPDRRMPARGSLDSDLWKSGYSDEEWPSRQLLWEMLEGAFGSEGFFDVIRAVRNSGDALAPGGRWLPELTAKVWRMLEAMGEDVLLREELFLMARDTTACVDAGAQLFNSMGVVVLLRSAYFSEDVASVRRAVFKLARGKWRLDELGRVAHDRVARLLEQGVKFPEYDEQGQRVQHEDAHGEPIGDIDEVEIYLAYTVPLATRLDLPWQSRTMMFREDYVTPSMVDSAFERVKALDQGEQLRTHLLEQPMWTDFLQRAHHAEYAVVAEKFDALIDYQAAQKKWAGDAGLSESARQALRQTIGQAAQRLGRSGADSEPGRLMSDSEYGDAFDRINAELITLNQRLTDQAISEFA